MSHLTMLKEFFRSLQEKIWRLIESGCRSERNARVDVVSRSSGKQFQDYLAH